MRNKLWPEAAGFREARQVSGGDANLLGTLKPVSSYLHYTKGNQKKKFV